ncbi:MAG: ketopantoate reductase family protein [Thermoplasmatota archaeon]
MKICVMGAGSVGAYFGGRLASKNAVSFIARGEHLESMIDQGLKIKSEVHDDFKISVNATDDPEEIGPVDLVLFTVKAYDTEEAGKQIEPLIGEDTIILSLQNGIDNEEILADMYGKDKVIGGVAYILSKVEQPGVIHHESLGRVEIGELNRKVTERIKEIKSTFESSDISCDISRNIKQVLWQKLAFNCALNAMTALTDSSLDTILKINESSEVFEETVREAVKVGVASGVDMDEDELISNLMKIARETGAMKSSMLYDKKKGKKLEIDPLNGKIVEMGEEFDIDTPMNKTLYGCLKIINETQDL